MEKSLVIIKPDGTVRRTVGALVVKALMDRGFKIRAFKEMKVPRSLAELHYAVHEDKPFFPWLVDFITSARVLVMILEGENVIQGVRDALGATFVQKAAPDSLRGRYGIWSGINIAHASDGAETATNEIELWLEHGGVEESNRAEDDARAYVKKYGSSGVDFTREIREVISTAIKSRDASKDVVKSLVDLLKKDSKGIGSKEIESLAAAIVTSIREEIEKSK
ncbi:MAG: nucleoside-diphosphate kinase [Candidatus Thorarchaeota archaeon]|nr:nucleoside-diphosphate kinase [Candidatus Thorarchaeota archaeon]